jgi:hypothetical protein
MMRCPKKDGPDAIIGAVLFYSNYLIFPKR